MNTKAHAPAHITGFFKIYNNGSTGAGINLAEGITTFVDAKKSKIQKTKIFINKKRSTALTSKSVVKKYLALKKEKYNFKINHKTKLPIGFGLGASGAGALSLSIALNNALGTKLSKKNVSKIAFDAEIENKTGLGDVTAQKYFGLIRGLPPFPSKKAKNILLKKKYCVCAFFSPIKTSSIIKSKNWKEKINKIGSYCMRKISKKPNEKNFVRLSRAFSVETGLATKNVRRVMDKHPYAMQAMLGSTVFILTNNPKETEKKLKKFSIKILTSKIAIRGAREL